MKVDLDTLLYGDPTPEQISDSFRQDFPAENYLVAAIKRHLMSQNDKRIIEQNNSSIEDMLNGRVRGDTTWKQQMYERWNSSLGFRCFGN
jgi:hypothetical protein